MRANPERMLAALKRFEDEMRRTGAPIVRYLAPGLPPPESVAIVQRELGLRLPVEAQLWFAWHNGVTRTGAEEGPGWFRWPAGYEADNLERCISQCRSWRNVATRAAKEIPQEAVWGPTWMPVATDSGGITLAVDCGVDEQEETPVRKVAAYEPDRSPVAFCLAEVVEYWAQLLEEGMWYYDPDSGAGWQQTFGRLDPGIRLGLVL